MSVDLFLHKPAWINNASAPTTTGSEVSPYSGNLYPFRSISMSTRSSGLFIGSCALQGSVDGTNWFNIVSLTISAGNTTYQFVETCVPYIRLNCSALTAGTLTVDVSALGEGRSGGN